MEPMVTDGVASPEFAVVVRGYDRAQVDEYLGELLAWVSESERRILAADEANESLRREIVQLRGAAASLEERAGAPGPQSLSAFGEKMGQLMQSAAAAADELRSDTEREANERRDAVAAEVERMLERAKAEAREIMRRARAKERELEEGIAALVARRSAAVEELGRVHRQLSDMLSSPDPASAPRSPGGERGSQAPSTPAMPGGAIQHGGPAEGWDRHGNVPSEPPRDADVTQAIHAIGGATGTPPPTMVHYPEQSTPGRGGSREGR